MEWKQITCFLLFIGVCFCEEPTSAEHVHPDLSTEIEYLKKNVTSLWVHFAKLHHSIAHQLNHLHLHQKAAETAIHSLAHRTEGDKAHDDKYCPGGNHCGDQHHHHHHKEEHGEEHQHVDGDDHSDHGDEHHHHHQHKEESGEGHQHVDGDDHSDHEDHHDEHHHHDEHDEHHHHEGHNDEHHHEDHHNDHHHEGHHDDHHDDHHDHHDSHESHSDHKDSHDHKDHKDSHESDSSKESQDHHHDSMDQPGDHSADESHHGHHHDNSHNHKSNDSDDHHHHHHHHEHNDYMKHFSEIFSEIHDHHSHDHEIMFGRPKFLNPELYNFATCEVQANRAIPKEQQHDVSGRINMWQLKTEGTLHLVVKLRGFKLDGDHGDHGNHTQGHHHGFHVHENGDLSNGCQSTGPHYNPENVAHGGRTSTVRHVGDLGNIECDSHGITNIAFTDSVNTLTGEHSIVGKSMVIHANEDDLGMNPDNPESSKTGNSGVRIACCIVEKVDKLPSATFKKKYYKKTKRYIMNKMN